LGTDKFYVLLTVHLDNLCNENQLDQAGFHYKAKRNIYGTRNTRNSTTPVRARILPVT
jgi:hypothetical protein